jgi:hypothetical protein
MTSSARPFAAWLQGLMQLCWVECQWCCSGAAVEVMELVCGPDRRSCWQHFSSPRGTG